MDEALNVFSAIEQWMVSVPDLTVKIWSSAFQRQTQCGWRRIFGLHVQNRKAGKSRSVQTIIQGEKPETMVQRMSSDEEVGKNSARAEVPLLSSASNILLECTALPMVTTGTGA